MQIHIDAQRRDQVYGTLLQAYRDNRYPFNLSTTVLPQDSGHMPPRIQQYPEYFGFYLLCLCYFMSATDSITATKCMTNLYAAHPRMFRPQHVVKMRPATIAKHLNAFGLGFREEDVAIWWIENARRLNERYDGNALQLAAAMPDYDTACLALLNDGKGGGLLGFQYKMVSMLLYYYMSVGLMDYYIAPVPVDFHVLRVTLANEVVKTDQPPGTDLLKPAMLRAIREASMSFCLEQNVSWLQLCDSLWPFGKAMCRHNPGNKSSQPQGYAARSTVIEANVPNWRPSEYTSWNRSCGNCVINDSCRWNIPSANYYRIGNLILRSERENPPIIQDNLFDIDLQTPKPKAKQTKKVPAVLPYEQIAWIEFTVEPVIDSTLTADDQKVLLNPVSILDATEPISEEALDAAILEIEEQLDNIAEEPTGPDDSVILVDR